MGWAEAWRGGRLGAAYGMFQMPSAVLACFMQHRHSYPDPAAEAARVI